MPSFKLNGKTISVKEETILASALLDHAVSEFRTSLLGEARAPLCGMGICQECRVTINGIPHQRACMILVVEGMEVTTE